MVRSDQTRETHHPAQRLYALCVNKAAAATVTFGLSHPGQCFHDTCTMNYSRDVIVK